MLATAEDEVVALTEARLLLLVTLTLLFDDARLVRVALRSEVLERIMGGWPSSFGSLDYERSRYYWASSWKTWSKVRISLDSSSVFTLT